MSSTEVSDSEIDIILYKTDNVQVFCIPPPRAEDGYKHNISRWNLDGPPLWEGSLELHEIELLDDYNGVNPFGGDDSHSVEARDRIKQKAPQDYFKLKLALVDNKTRSVFATVPNVSSLDKKEPSIVPTDSSKVYAIFPETDDDIELEIDSIKPGAHHDPPATNNNIKRIGMGLKLPSSYEASNFSMYLNQFEKDYRIFAESLRQETEEYIESIKTNGIQQDSNGDIIQEDDDDDHSHENDPSDAFDKKINDLESQFYEVSVDDDDDVQQPDNIKLNQDTTMKTNKFESESDESDSDDDFGEFSKA